MTKFYISIEKERKFYCITLREEKLLENTTQIKTKLLFNGDVQSVNYSIKTVEAVVYVMGIAQSQSELNLVLETARHVPNVQKVVSYVKMLDTRS